MKTKFSAEAVLHIIFAAFLTGIILVAGVGYIATQRTQESGTAGLKAAADIGTALGLVRAADSAARTQITEFPQLLARAWSSSGQQEAVTALRARNELIQRQLEEAQQLLARNQLDASSLTEAVQAQAKIVKDYEERLQQAMQGSNVEAAKATWKDAAPSVEKLAQQLSTQIDANHASRSATLIWLFSGMVVAGFAMAAFFRWWIRRANVGPLIIATKLVQRVAGGDLTARADNMDFQHTRKIAQALNEMTESLRNLVGEVVRSAQTVADTSSQIAQGNLDLSQRTEEQASTLEETASSMEQLTSTVAQNADNAKQASQLAVEASDVARRGGQVVSQVVSTMNGISQSSRKIGDIIGVIDGIAFQTNILALNAAVEAARAGEQGRGFAVVAQEVRNLAQRSAAAAKEIKTLIGDSVGRVEAGTRQVDAAGKTMEEIVASVKQVADLIAEIAAASREQSAGIGQINTAIAQMEQVVQQNASLVEEASAATESMKDQASSLLGAVSRFHLGAASAPAQRETTPITQIKVQPGSAALPPAYAAVLDNAKSSRAPAGRAGDWEEF